MRLLKNSVVALCVSASFSSYAVASQGFYLSISGTSAKQEHKTSDYTLTYQLPPSTITMGNSGTFVLASSSRPVFNFNSNAALLDGYLSALFSYDKPISYLSQSNTSAGSMFTADFWNNLGNTFSSYFRFNNGCETSCLFHEGDIIDAKSAMNSFLSEFKDLFPNTVTNVQAALNPSDLTTLVGMFNEAYWQNIADGFLAESVNDPTAFLTRANAAIANDPNISQNSTIVYKIFKYIDNRFAGMADGMQNSVIASIRQNTAGNYNINLNSNNTFFSVSDLVVKDGAQTIMTFSQNSSGNVVGTYSDSYQTAMKSAASSYETAAVNTQQQMQDFLRAISGQSAKGAEVNMGYKFRGHDQLFFISPQLDFTYFNAKKRQTLYTNTKGTTAYTFSPTAINTVAFTNDTLNVQYAAGLSTRLGFDFMINAGFFRLPFSIYGLAGGVMTQQSYKNNKVNNLGFKYGFGSEIFLSRKLALFGEYYRINLPKKTVKYSEVVTDYQITATESFALKSDIDVIRAGLIYYFN